MLLENLTKLTHNSTLRLALSYLIVFIFSSLILLAFIYWSSVEYIYKQLDHHISYDMENMKSLYQQEGKNKLIQSITQRLNQRSYDSVYLLYDKKLQQKLVGNLTSLGLQLADGWHHIALDKLSKDLHHKTHSARILKTQLSPQLILINGLDTESAHEQEHIIINNMLIGIAIIFVLGTIGSFILSINTIKKISLINSSIQKVGYGNIRQRIPIEGSDDEFDLLANHINHMLGRIFRLIEKVQNISNNIAHDLRTPLTRIRNQLESLQDKNEGKNTDDVDLIIEETDNLLATFETILNINKFESGAQKLNLQTLSSNKLLTDVIEYNEPLAFDKSISITLNDNKNYPFQGDQNMLFLALTNLLNNAIKYTPDNGEIRVFTKIIEKQFSAQASYNSFLEITISDNGMGISDKEKESVFELFYRCDKSRDNQGNGLGLSLVSAVIKLHKGIIELQDNKPGLKVCLYLPLDG